MFTRFSAPRGPRTPPVAGTLVSLTTHAVVVVLAVGGPTSLVGSAAGVAIAARGGGGGGGGEGIHWVGADHGVPNTPAPPGALPPIAYVIPGRGTPRPGTPGSPGERRGPPRADLPLPPAPRRPEAALALRIELPRLALAVPPDLDAAILVAGVVAAAPDLRRLVSRVEDFVRRPGSGELSDGLLGRGDASTGEELRPLGQVDVMPVALVSNPLPVYPAELARARVDGRVLVEFRIDSAGAVDLESLRVVQSTNALFTQAVRGALPRMRFLPAQVDRHAVGITVRQPFVFRTAYGR